MENIAEVYDAVASENPEFFASIEEDGSSLQYRELVFRSSILATILVQELPVNVKCVALRMQRCNFFLVCYVALARLRIPVVGLSCDLENKELQNARNRDICSRLNPIIIGTDDGDISVDELQRRVSDMEATLSNPQSYHVQAKSGSREDVLVYAFTGGTTSHSKCAMVSHTMAIHEVSTYPVAIGDPKILEKNLKVLQNSTLYWGAASFGQLSLALSMKGAICWGGKRAGIDGLEADIRKCDVIGVVPSILHSFEPNDFPNLKLIFCWGEFCDDNTVAKWSKNAVLIDALIATEYWFSFASINRNSGRRKSPLVVMPGVKHKVVKLGDGEADLKETRTLLECGPGESGELLVGGDCLSPGYTDEYLNHAAMLEHKGQRYFRTRDLVKVVDQQSFEYEGRRDDWIKAPGGKFVQLTLMEKQYENLGAEEVACISAPDGIHVFVVGSKESFHLISSTTYRGWTVHHLSSLPRSVATGKVDRRELLGAFNLDGNERKYFTSARERYEVDQRNVKGVLLRYRLGHFFVNGIAQGIVFGTSIQMFLVIVLMRSLLVPYWFMFTAGLNHRFTVKGSETSGMQKELDTWCFGSLVIFFILVDFSCMFVFRQFGMNEHCHLVLSLFGCVLRSGDYYANLTGAIDITMKDIYGELVVLAFRLPTWYLYMPNFLQHDLTEFTIRPWSGNFRWYIGAMGDGGSPGSILINLKERLIGSFVENNPVPTPEDNMQKLADQPLMPAQSLYVNLGKVGYWASFFIILTLSHHVVTLVPLVFVAVSCFKIFQYVLEEYTAHDFTIPGRENYGFDGTRTNHRLPYQDRRLSCTRHFHDVKTRLPKDKSPLRKLARKQCQNADCLPKNLRRDLAEGYPYDHCEACKLALLHEIELTAPFSPCRLSSMSSAKVSGEDTSCTDFESGLLDDKSSTTAVQAKILALLQREFVVDGNVNLLHAPLEALGLDSTKVTSFTSELKRAFSVDIRAVEVRKATSAFALARVVQAALSSVREAAPRDSLYPEDDNKHAGIITWRCPSYNRDHYKLMSHWNFVFLGDQEVELQRIEDMVIWLVQRHAILRSWPYDNDLTFRMFEEAINVLKLYSDILPPSVTQVLTDCLVMGWPRMRVLPRNCRNAPFVIKTFAGEITEENMNTLRNSFNAMDVYSYPPCVIVLWIHEAFWSECVKSQVSRNPMVSSANAFLTFYISHQLVDGSVVRGLLSDVNEFLRGESDIVNAPNACRQIERRLVDSIRSVTEQQDEYKIYNQTLWSHLPKGFSGEGRAVIFRLSDGITRALTPHLKALGLSFESFLTAAVAICQAKAKREDVLSFALMSGLRDGADEDRMLGDVSSWRYLDIFLPNHLSVMGALFEVTNSIRARKFRPYPENSAHRKQHEYLFLNLLSYPSMASGPLKLLKNTDRFLNFSKEKVWKIPTTTRGTSMYVEEVAKDEWYIKIDALSKRFNVGAILAWRILFAELLDVVVEGCDRISWAGRYNGFFCERNAEFARHYSRLKNEPRDNSPSRATAG